MVGTFLPDAPSVSAESKTNTGDFHARGIRCHTRDQARPLNVVREQITVLAPGSRTGGYEIFRQAGPEGSGPPPHYHPWDESFYVVSGNIAFGVGDKDMIAEPVTLVHLPAGTMHWFRFGEGGGEMISMTSREAASHFFTDVDRAISPRAARPSKECCLHSKLRHRSSIICSASFGAPSATISSSRNLRGYCTQHINHC